MGGGVRSGKSAFALRRAQELGPRRVFVATCPPVDDEMRRRIEAHRRERGPDFETVEVTTGLVPCLETLEADVALVDCVTLWLSNLLHAGHGEAAVLDEVARLSDLLRRRRFDAILVTNEVGMGVVPEHPLGRAFRDLAGRTHQILARAADEVVFGAMGLVLRLKPAPVEVIA